MAGNAAQRPIRKRESGQSDPRVPPQVRASVTSLKPCVALCQIHVKCGAGREGVMRGSVDRLTLVVP